MTDNRLKALISFALDNSLLLLAGALAAVLWANVDLATYEGVAHRRDDPGRSCSCSLSRRRVRLPPPASGFARDGAIDSRLQFCLSIWSTTSANPPCVADSRRRLSAQSFAGGGVEPPGSAFVSELEARPNWWTRSVRLPFRIRTDARLTSPMGPPSSTSSPADFERPIF
jgi:hypothetical protein